MYKKLFGLSPAIPAVSLHRSECVAGDVVVAHLAECLGVGDVREVALGTDHVELPEQFLLGRLLDGPLRDRRVVGHVLNYFYVLYRILIPLTVAVLLKPAV